MKLLFVVHQFFPKYITGTEQYVRAMALAGLQAGHQIDVFALEPDFALAPPGFKAWRQDYDALPVHRVTVGNSGLANPVLGEFDNPVVGQHFAALLEELRPDAVHFFHVRYLGANLLDIAREAGCGIAVNLMDFWYMCPRVTLLKQDGSLCDGPRSADADCVSCAYSDLDAQFELAVSSSLDAVAPPAYADGILRHTDTLGDLHLAAVLRADHLAARWQSAHRVFAPSRFLADRFAANGFVHPGVRVVSYGVDTEQLDNVEHTEAPGLRIGFIGTLANHKGLHVLIDAFTQVEGDDLSLSIYGRMEDFPDYARDRQHQAAGDKRIVFHGAFDAADRAATLSRLDVLVVPSLWYENTPFVVLEALAAGVPVITSRLGGMTEAYVEGESGLSFPPGDSAALAAILAKLGADPDQMARLRAGVGPVKSVQDNWSEFEQAYCEIVDEVAAARPEPTAARERTDRDLYDLRITLATQRMRAARPSP